MVNDTRVVGQEEEGENSISSTATAVFVYGVLLIGMVPIGLAV